MNGHDKFMAARISACSQMPYATRLIMSMSPIATSEIPYAATDCRFRLYYNPDAFLEHNMAQNRWVIWHEVLHVFYSHSDRCKAILGDKPDDWHIQCWRIAIDLCVNRDLEGFSDAGSPPEGVLSFSLKEYSHLPKEASAEQIYHELLKEDHEDSPLHGSGAQSRIESFEAGDGEGEDGVDAGLDKDAIEAIKDEMARKAVEASGCGHLPAGIIREASKYVRSAINVKREILNKIRRAVMSAKGYREITWKRPPRKPNPFGFASPTMLDYIPRPIVIIDTSASMDRKRLQRAISLVADVVNALPDQQFVHIVAGDTQIETCTKAFRSEQIHEKDILVGGGGTDMGRIMENAIKKFPDGDAVLVVTDGYTPWPSVQPRIACFAALTEGKRGQEPAWLQCIDMRINRGQHEK
jgi:predicted metal-dependent peptidase